MKPFNQEAPRLELIAGHESEKRAIEIAFIGNHPVCFLINKGSQIPTLLMTANRIAFDLQIPFKGLAYFWCPCGNYGTLKDECLCKMGLIEKHLGKLKREVSKYDIWIQSNSYPKQYHIGEVEEDFIERVRKSRIVREERLKDKVLQANTSSPLKLLSDSSLGLLIAYQKKMSDKVDVKRVVKLATTIASAYFDSDNETTSRPFIQQHHLALALQYQPSSISGLQGHLKD
jgi:predicted ATPase with chaperone activity